jgi:hypothetical protein
MMIRVPALLLLILLGSGCAGGPESSDFCRSVIVNKFERSDGLSSPIVLNLAVTQHIEITYAARWDDGKVEAQIQTEEGRVIWKQSLQKTDTPQTIKVTTLASNKYLLFSAADNATNGVICMTGVVK